MSLINSFGPVRAFALGLALISLAPAQAQKTTVKTNKSKVKTKISDASGTTVSKTTVVAPSAPVVAMEPQYAPRPANAPEQPAPAPVSPVASSPQVVTAAPAAPAGLPAEWISDLGAAQAQAKATNRPILAVFSGSDWCKPCIMYEQEVFAKPEFMAYAKDKLVLAHFDFPRMKKNQPTAAQLKLNEAAAAQLNKEGDFPLAVVIAPDGKVLAKTGYIAGGPAAFEAYLKKVVPTL
ncbi:thioredoxin family protein [Hymenobacter siberiensis]|jgi:thiol-disulfide isomerase/thioredoxin|uniref:thioredoxin family protein n=1 Tax=Hymenobacter siberiensis TaxID=2848396 RepID=UPI001C1DDB45|nr:thioredoxin family protein [Hymenobacter siberiensis]MBU6120796.1 thioredoxin family protein [Hymenobacter siberiensis]